MSRRRIRAASMVVVLAMTALLVPAGRSGSAQDEITMGALLFQGDSFFQNIERGMKEVAEANGVELLVNNSNNDPAQEATFMETFTSAGVDAILISPLSEEGSVQSIRAASEAGIPIICYNGCIAEEFAEQYVEAVVTTDQRELGRNTGEAMKRYVEEELGGEAKVGILNCDRSEACGLRKIGFQEVLEGVAGVEYVADQEGTLADTATDIAENMLTGNPDINVLYAANEGGTVGAATAVKNQGLAGEVVVFGTDISPQLAEMLLSEDDILQTVTGQSPVAMGGQAVENALKVLAGEPIETFIQVTPSEVYSREDPAKVEAYLRPAAATPSAAVGSATR